MNKTITELMTEIQETHHNGSDTLLSSNLVHQDIAENCKHDLLQNDSTTDYFDLYADRLHTIGDIDGVGIQAKINDRLSDFTPLVVSLGKIYGYDWEGGNCCFIDIDQIINPHQKIKVLGWFLTGLQC